MFTLEIFKPINVETVNCNKSPTDIRNFRTVCSVSRQLLLITCGQCRSNFFHHLRLHKQINSRKTNSSGTKSLTDDES